MCLTIIAHCAIIHLVIRSFANPDAEAVFRGQKSRSLPLQLLCSALRKLLILDGADGIQDLRVPSGNRLEKLIGDRAGQYSIRINEQWRICFEWREGNAYRVEIVDYH